MNASPTQPASAATKQTDNQKTFVIERTIPGAGQLSAEQLKGISQTSCSVLKELGPEIQWVHSYVTGNKVFCIYRAPSEAWVRDHAKRGGFPVDAVSEVATVISPQTAA